MSEGKGCTLGNLGARIHERDWLLGREQIWEVWFESPSSFVTEGKACTLGNSGAGF